MKKSLLETGAVLSLVIAAVRLCYEGRFTGWFAPYVAVAAAAILAYTALFHARLRREPVDYLDRSVRDWQRSIGWFAAMVLWVIPPFLVANHFWQEWIFHRIFLPRAIPEWVPTLITQLFLVALPEEIFFRGWLQNRLKRVFERRWSVLGVGVGWGWILTAALFAAAHSVIFYQWWHFAIFFPGLVFGWLREKTGTITAPTLFHCVSNLAVTWIGVSYI